MIGSDEEQAMVANRVSVSKANVWLGLSDTVRIQCLEACTMDFNRKTYFLYYTNIIMK